MTTLARPKDALLIIDVQNAVVDAAHQRDERVATMAVAVEHARRKQVPVIWVQHSDPWLVRDSEDWRIVPELSPLEEEHRVHKLYRSSFEATNLEEILSELEVGHLYVAGAETNNCVRHTSHAALERGYDVTLLSDAHTTSSFDTAQGLVDAEIVITELNANFADYQLPGRMASAILVAELPW